MTSASFSSSAARAMSAVSSGASTTCDSMRTAARCSSNGSTSTRTISPRGPTRPTHTASPGSVPVKLRSSARRTIAAVPWKSVVTGSTPAARSPLRARSSLRGGRRAPTSWPSSMTVTSVMIESSRTQRRAVPLPTDWMQATGWPVISPDSTGGFCAARAPKFVSTASADSRPLTNCWIRLRYSCSRSVPSLQKGSSRSGVCRQPYSILPSLKLAQIVPWAFSCTR